MDEASNKPYKTMRSTLINDKGNPLEIDETKIFKVKYSKDEFLWKKKTRYYYDTDDETVMLTWTKLVDERDRTYKILTDKRGYRDAESDKILSRIDCYEECFSSNNFSNMLSFKHTAVSIGKDGHEIVREHYRDKNGKHDKTTVHCNGDCMVIQDRYY